MGTPLKFLESILVELRKDGLVASRRGFRGGSRLAKPPNETSVASVIRAVDGPLPTFEGSLPRTPSTRAPPSISAEVWVAVRASLRSVLGSVTLANVVAGRLPRAVGKLTEDPDAWSPHEAAQHDKP